MLPRSNHGVPFQSLVAAYEAKKNLTKMIIALNVFFIIAHFMPLFTFFASNAFGYQASISIVITIFANTLLFMTHSFSIFIYLTCDKLFRSTIQSIIKRT